MQTDITLQDMQYAKAMGMKIKLLATCRKNGERLGAVVAPCLLGKKHPLYNVEDVFNAIFYKREYAWRCNVLWKRSRKTPYGKRSCG